MSICLLDHDDIERGSYWSVKDLKRYRFRRKRRSKSLNQTIVARIIILLYIYIFGDYREGARAYVGSTPFGLVWKGWGTPSKVF